MEVTLERFEELISDLEKGNVTVGGLNGAHYGNAGRNDEA